MVVYDADGEPVDAAAFPDPIASVTENRFTIGCGDERSSLVAPAGGPIVVAIAGSEAARLYALGPTLETLPGWPRPFPGDPPGDDGMGGNGCRGFAVAPDGGILAWGYEGIQESIELVADRTEFVRYGPDGATVAGWPRGSQGAASAPVLSPDGSVLYTSATGKVWRHTADGDIAAGWPYQLPDRSAPVGAPDGRVALTIRRDTANDAVVILRPDGRAAAGGPITLSADVESRCLFGDTPCMGTVAPVFGPDGRLYVGLAAANDREANVSSSRGGSVVAIDRDGDVAAGWPVRLPERTHVTALSAAETGGVVVDAVRCAPGGCGDAASERLILRFGPDGEVLED